MTPVDAPIKNKRNYTATKALSHKSYNKTDCFQIQPKENLFLCLRVLVAEFLQTKEPLVIYKIKPAACQKKRNKNGTDDL